MISSRTTLQARPIASLIDMSPRMNRFIFVRCTSTLPPQRRWRRPGLSRQSHHARTRSNVKSGFWHAFDFLRVEVLLSDTSDLKRFISIVEVRQPMPKTQGHNAERDRAAVPPPASQRACFQLQVRPERLAQYRQRHAAAWPEMLQALKDSGWNNYSLFIRPDGLLIGYVETPDLAAAQRAMAATEVNARWQAQMGEFFLDLDGDPDRKST